MRGLFAEVFMLCSRTRVSAVLSVWTVNVVCHSAGLHRWHTREREHLGSAANAFMSDIRRSTIPCVTQTHPHLSAPETFP